MGINAYKAGLLRGWSWTAYDFMRVWLQYNDHKDLGIKLGGKPKP